MVQGEVFHQKIFTTIVESFRDLGKFSRKFGFGYLSRQDAKSAKFGQYFFLKPLRTLRLCERYSETWLRLCRVRSFVVKTILSSLVAALPR
jgi:hypothetical protein